MKIKLTMSITFLFWKIKPAILLVRIILGLCMRIFVISKPTFHIYT